MSAYNINLRLAKLGRKQVDIILELRKRGYIISQANFSSYKNGHQTGPMSSVILAQADKILTEWETERS